MLRLGTDLLRFRSVVTSAEQVKEVQVRGWDVAQKKALVATAPAKTTSAELPTITPADIAKTFGDPVYVATDVPYRTQAEVDGRGGRDRRADRRRVRRVRGRRPGQPETAGRTPRSRSTTSARRSTASTRSPPRGTATTRPPATPPSFAVTGRQERSLLGLAPAAAVRGAGQGPVIAQVSDANDPQKQGRVKLTFPWLSDDYVSDWARTVQPGAGQGPRRDGAARGRRRGAGAFEQGDIRRPYVLGGLYNGVDTPPTGGPTLIDGSSGAINRRSMVSRRGHRIDLLDEDGRTEGITPVDHRRQAAAQAGPGRHQDHRAQRRQGADRGQGRRSSIDAASSKLELKGGEITSPPPAGSRSTAAAAR